MVRDRQHGRGRALAAHEKDTLRRKRRPGHAGLVPLRARAGSLLFPTQFVCQTLRQCFCPPPSLRPTSALRLHDNARSHRASAGRSFGARHACHAAPCAAIPPIPIPSISYVSFLPRLCCPALPCPALASSAVVVPKSLLVPSLPGLSLPLRCRHDSRLRDLGHPLLPPSHPPCLSPTIQPSSSSTRSLLPKSDRPKCLREPRGGRKRKRGRS